MVAMGSQSDGVASRLLVSDRFFKPSKLDGCNYDMWNCDLALRAFACGLNPQKVDLDIPLVRDRHDVI